MDCRHRLGTPAGSDADALALAADVAVSLGSYPGRVAAVGPTVRIEGPDGPSLVPSLAASFGARFRSLTLGAPSLEDVFVDRTGHRFDEPAGEDGRAA